MLAETILYLLRNHDSDKAISFFSKAGFRPDFILWLVRDSHQTIAFLDPKGMRNFTDTFNNPKVQFFRRIKELEKLLKRDEIRLESFLLSQTYRDELRYRSHHILCAKDDSYTHVKDLIGLL